MDGKAVKTKELGCCPNQCLSRGYAQKPNFYLDVFVVYSTLADLVRAGGGFCADHVTI